MRTAMTFGWLVLFSFISANAVCADGPASDKPFPPDSVKFKLHRVGTYRSEACDVGDFNNDGKLDIIAGPFLYLAPDWKAKKVRTLKGEVDEQGKGYRYDFMNIALDVDGDGLLDVVSCSWHERSTTWYRNTGSAGGEWPESLIEVRDNFECGEAVDIDGDGKKNEILAHTRATVWYEAAKAADGKQGMIVHVVSLKPLMFGGGAGDVNGDGRIDILRPDGWYEAPADPRKGQWKEHPVALGCIEEGKAEHTPQILVHDVNSDGLADIVTSSAHRHGIFWYQQLRNGSEITWKQHVIDKTWTQAHSLALADLDNDGDPDLVSGKRFMAHNGNDPDADSPPGLYWYELKPGRTTVWVKHVISYDEGIGSGMHIPVVDMDADGDLDIVVTGKFGGPVWFENKAR